MWTSATACRRRVTSGAARTRQAASCACAPPGTRLHRTEPAARMWMSVPEAPHPAPTAGVRTQKAASSVSAPWASNPTLLAPNVDECENHLACPGQECVNSPGSFQCRTCPSGHHLHRGRCTDVDECSSGAPPCGPHGHCTNTEGSFRCSCAPGYRAPSGRPGPCADVNECLEGDFCFPHGECLNTDGSFACTCAPGYRPGPRGASCLGSYPG
uniref:cDNA FLJ58718, moderately similar to Homo sapiens latent transforming growth factor beta binding protein 4 (LTBP4), mRNA n=1 Tax=Homo sapiens TaxID=9606 RepID=B7Z8L2_HUMAN|nr:unnamed protein product [Homo sapiens]